MDFVTIYSFCEDILQAMRGLIQPIIWLFSLTFAEYLDYLVIITPLWLKPFLNGFSTLVDFVGIGNMSILVFLFGGGIVFYFAFTFIKWILDIAL